MVMAQKLQRATRCIGGSMGPRLHPVKKAVALGTGRATPTVATMVVAQCPYVVLLYVGCVAEHNPDKCHSLLHKMQTWTQTAP